MKSKGRTDLRWSRWAIFAGISTSCAVALCFCVHGVSRPVSPVTTLEASPPMPTLQLGERNAPVATNERPTNGGSNRSVPPLQRALREPEPDAERSSLEAPDFEGPALDPFSPQMRNAPEVRVLVARGDLRLGVLQSSQVLDEPALKELLATIGSDLEELASGGDRPGATDFQEVLDGYKDALGRCAQGEVEIRGPGWMIGVEVGEPGAVGDNWHPRPL